MKVSLVIFASLFILHINCFAGYDRFVNPSTISDRGPKPRTLDDCIAQLDRTIPDSTKAKISLMTEDEFLASSHFSLGLSIRNNWGLWKGSRLSRFFNEKGIYHPDDMSGIIICSYYRHLTKQDIKLEEQIKSYQDYWKKVLGN